MKRLITVALIILISTGCGDKRRTERTSGDIGNIEHNTRIGKPIPNIIKPDIKEFQNLAKVENFLPKGYSRNGDVDYTEIIQRVLDKNRNVEFPDFPVLVNDKGLLVQSNSNLVFNDNSLIRLKSSDKLWYAILHLKNVENISIYSPKIEGDRHRRLNPESEEGSWGMGLVIKSSKNINIYNPTITKCWGDGVYMGRGDAKVPNEDVLIYQAVLDNNRRNGISIICGKNISIIEPVISNTRGTPPESGIDVEPNGPEDIIDDLTIKNPYTYNNGTIGIVLSLSQLVSDVNRNVNITITDHVDEYSKYGFMIASFRSEKKKSDKRLSGNILIKNSSWMFNEYPYMIGTTRGLCPRIEFVNSKIYSDDKNSDQINVEMQNKMKSEKFVDEIFFN